MKIGIGITCHNRNEISEDTIKKWIDICPKDFKIVVVDDASTIPIKNVTYRFEINAGIAKAKNKCLELLDDCDHIFLSDDDVYPITKDWYKPYINSGKNHLMFTFHYHDSGELNGHKFIATENGFSRYSHPCGCMMYIKRNVLDVVGGFDERYRKYGHEHVDFSNRVFNNRLSEHHYEDVENSLKLFYSHDFYKTTKSSVKNKRAHINVNNQLIVKNYKSKQFMPYKPLKTALITSFFNTVIDTQRNIQWEANPLVLKPLIKSLINTKLIVITDCLNEQDTEQVQYIKVKATENPYFQRWISILEFLKNSNYDFVFCVDANDVIMLNNPFNELKKGYIYTGDERNSVACKWILENHPIQNEDYKKFIYDYRFRNLLNAGIVGGDKNTLIKFCSLITDFYYQNNKDLGMTDMAAFNFIIYKNFENNLKFGNKINTIFKKYENTDLAKQKGIWFKHK